MPAASGRSSPLPFSEGWGGVNNEGVGFPKFRGMLGVLFFFFLGNPLKVHIVSDLGICRDPPMMTYLRSPPDLARSSNQSRVTAMGAPLIASKDGVPVKADPWPPAVAQTPNPVNPKP